MKSAFIQNQQELINFCELNDISSLKIFGSQLRDDVRPDSDLDLLVDFSNTKTLFDLVEIEEALTKIINKKVDLVTKNSLSPLIRPYVDLESQILYERA